ELVTLQVPLVLQLNVTGEGVRGTELVHDHRVVDDEIDRDKRVDLARIAAQRVHAITHGRKVHDRRHAREVLHQHAGRAEADLLFDLATIIKPRRNRGDVVPRYRAAILVAKKVLQKYLHRVRQTGNAVEAIPLSIRQ